MPPGRGPEDRRQRAPGEEDLPGGPGVAVRVEAGPRLGPAPGEGVGGQEHLGGEGDGHVLDVLERLRQTPVAVERVDAPGEVRPPAPGGDEGRHGTVRAPLAPSHLPGLVDEGRAGAEGPAADGVARDPVARQVGQPPHQRDAAVAIVGAQGVVGIHRVRGRRDEVRLHLEDERREGGCQAPRRPQARQRCLGDPVRDVPGAPERVGLPGREHGAGQVPVRDQHVGERRGGVERAVDRVVPAPKGVVVPGRAEMAEHGHGAGVQGGDEGGGAFPGRRKVVEARPAPGPVAHPRRTPPVDDVREVHDPVGDLGLLPVRPVPPGVRVEPEQRLDQCGVRLWGRRRDGDALRREPRQVVPGHRLEGDGGHAATLRAGDGDDGHPGGGPLGVDGDDPPVADDAPPPLQQAVAEDAPQQVGRVGLGGSDGLGGFGHGGSSTRRVREGCTAPSALSTRRPTRRTTTFATGGAHATTRAPPTPTSRGVDASVTARGGRVPRGLERRSR